MLTSMPLRWRCGCVVVALLLAPCPGAGETSGKGGLHIPKARPVSFTAYLRDGAGHRWDIQYYLNIGQGSNNVYSGGLYCRVSGSNVSSNGRGWMSPAGDEIEIGPYHQGGYVAYRRCKVYRDQGLARWLDIFVNNTNSVQTIPVRIYTSTQAAISGIITPSGAGSVRRKDWAFITQHRSGRASLLHIVCGPRSKVRPTVSASGNTIRYDYKLTLRPRGTAVLCYFESQGRSVDELKKRLKGFRASATLKDLSPEVRKLIVNFRTSDGLQEVELERRGASDTVILKNGDPIFGRIANEKFTLQAFYGDLNLPADDVVGFVQAAGQDDLMRAVLAGGQVLTGKLRGGKLKFALPTGGDLNIPFSRIKECSYRISKEKPERSEMTDPLIVLRTGDRLAFDVDALNITFQTRHGTILLNGKDLMEVRLHHEEHGVHRAAFLNGAKLAGLLGLERIVLPLKLGPKLDISRDMVHLLRFATEAKHDPELAWAKLSNGDELYGRISDEQYHVATDFGTVTVRPRNISAMSFDPLDPTRVAIGLWDGSTLRGHLRQQTLRFALEPGPLLKLYVGHVVDVKCPGALPPEDVIKRVEKYVGMLSAANYKDREEAQEALTRMGAKIAPLLKKHLKDPDPEVRQRIGVILAGIRGEANETPGDPPPAAWWEAPGRR